MNDPVAKDSVSGSSPGTPTRVPLQTRGVTSVPAVDSGQEASQHDHVAEYVDAASATGKLLELLGIKRVIDVDDSWHDDSQPDLDLVAAVISSGVMPLEELEAKESTRPLVTGLDGQLLTADEVIARLRRGEPSLSNTVLGELTDAAKVLAEDDEEWPEEPDGAELKAAESSATAGAQDRSEVSSEAKTDSSTLLLLRQMIEPQAEFIPLTLAAWNRRRDDLLRDETPTLLLFDQDFSREGGAFDEGEKVLAPLLARDDLPHIAFGLLTHRVAELSDEQRMASEIAHRFSMDPGRVIVIAKGRIQEAPHSLPAALRVAMVGKELQILRQRTVEALEAATRASVQKISTMDSWTALAMLAAARYEGMHEPDGFVRTALTAYRRQLAIGLRHDDVITGPLPKLRHALDLELRPLGVEKPVQTWPIEREERYDSAEHLSSLHLPLETGDIFRLENPERLAGGKEPAATDRLFILLVQPCDAAVRANGRRAYEPKAFVVASLKPRGVADSPLKSSEVLLENFDQTDGSPWVVQLSARSYVPARALDACVVSADGSGLIALDEPMPGNLTPPWQKRFQSLHGWAQKALAKLERIDSRHEIADRELRKLIIGSLVGGSSELHGVGVAIDTASRRVAFGLRRVGRLTDPQARALLTLASQYQARPALDGPLLLDFDAAVV